MKEAVRNLTHLKAFSLCLLFLISGQVQSVASNLPTIIPNNLSRTKDIALSTRNTRVAASLINGTNTYSSTSANKALALGAVTVQGELKKWHKITLLIEGPSTSETNGSNPFLNYRLNVTFTNGSKKYVV
ncbi:DUF5060 domain-containing protein, partial [Larkinella arboricola]